MLNQKTYSQIFLCHFYIDICQQEKICEKVKNSIPNICSSQTFSLWEQTIILISCFNKKAENISESQVYCLFIITIIIFLHCGSLLHNMIVVSTFQLLNTCTLYLFYFVHCWNLNTICNNIVKILIIWKPACYTMYINLDIPRLKRENIIGEQYLIIVQVNMVKHVEKHQNSCNLHFTVSFSKNLKVQIMQRSMN